MTAAPPRAWALACTQCGGSLRVTSTALLDCPSCGAPLAVQVPGSWPRDVVRPRVEPLDAVERARGALTHPQTARRFLAEGRWERPRLVFVALYDVERTLADRGGRRTETREIAPAVRLPELPIEELRLASLAGRDREGFDPVALQRRGTVLDPSLPVEEALPAPGTTRVLEEQVRVVYAPVWVLECRYGRNVYGATIDATTGMLLGGRAPVERTARLGEALVILYFLAFLLASQPTTARWYWAIVSHFDDAMVPVIGVTLGSLATLLAWSWDRIRFRYEIVARGGGLRLRAVNRPERTLPERVARFFLGSEGGSSKA